MPSNDLKDRSFTETEPSASIATSRNTYPSTMTSKILSKHLQQDTPTLLLVEKHKNDEANTKPTAETLFDLFCWIVFATLTILIASMVAAELLRRLGEHFWYSSGCWATYLVFFVSYWAKIVMGDRGRRQGLRHESKAFVGVFITIAGLAGAALTRYLHGRLLVAV